MARLANTCSMEELGNLHQSLSELERQILNTKNNTAKCIIANSTYVDSDEKLMNLGFELVYKYKGNSYDKKEVYVWMKDLNAPSND